MVNDEYLESLNQVINRQHQAVERFCSHIDKPVKQLECTANHLIKNGHHKYSISEQLQILKFLQDS